MTIGSETSKNQYTGNGVLATFAYTFKIFNQNDIDVLLDDTLQTITTHYTVTGVGSDSGGNIVFVTAPGSSVTVTLKRDEPFTQDIDYVENDDFPAASHEEGLDRSVIRDQQLQEQLNRAITLSAGSTLSNLTFPDPTGNAEKYIRVNSTANGFEYQGILSEGDLTVSPYIETLLDDTTSALARATLEIPFTPASSTEAAFQDFAEDTDNGSNKIKLQAPASIASDATVTLPDEAGTLARLEGTDTNDNASAGQVGEIITAELASGSATGLATGTAKTITSISLTAGDWDVWGNVGFLPNTGSGTTVEQYLSCISLSDNTVSTAPFGGGFSSISMASNAPPLGTVLSAGMTRVSIASTTTVYLVARSTFGTSTMTAYGFIGARRRR